MKSLKMSLLGAVCTMAFSVSAFGAITGSVVDETAAPMKDVVVQIKTVPNLIPDARVLSNELGKFSFKDAAAKAKNADDKKILVARKAGFLPETLSVAAAADLGNITLKRDPIEFQIDSIMATMNLDAMIAQMTQPMVPNVDCNGYVCGSALQGGGAYRVDFYTTAWNQKIPALYGKDNVHGVGDVDNATVFPHNIGLGATRDSALVRRIGQVVAEEMWAAHIDYNFAPALSVPRNERWGRTYEGFGEIPELVAELGAAYIRGLQGDHFDAEHRAIATVKHFLGDGITAGGVDRADVKLSEKEIRKIALPPYEAAVEQGALSAMASFNSIHGVHQHVDSLHLTGLLKTELGFEGFVIADWEGIENSRTPGMTDGFDYKGGVVASSEEAIKKAINAGIDMSMAPNSWSGFMNTVKTLVEKGEISEDRIKDAVRRILRTKIRAGRLANPMGPTKYEGSLGSAEHRAVAREAVRKSLVLLKNKGTGADRALPLSKTGKIFLTGTHADNTGLQCGAWTKGWQGTTGEIPGATSIKKAFENAAAAAMVDNEKDAETIVYVIGEEPYAEWRGDFRDKNFDNMFYRAQTKSFDSAADDLKQIKAWKKMGKKVVLVLISGRPLPITQLIDASDAFVAAWLPGSEGGGVADVLFGDYAPTGKLPHTWPKNSKQIPINVGDGKKGLFPYGFGLTY